MTNPHFVFLFGVAENVHDLNSMCSGEETASQSQSGGACFYVPIFQEEAV